MTGQAVRLDGFANPENTDPESQGRYSDWDLLRNYIFMYTTPKGFISILLLLRLQV